MPKTDSVVVSELYVVLGKDDEGNEGVAVGIDVETGLNEPLIGSRRRLPRVLELAQLLANDSGRELALVKFTTRGNLQVFKPEDPA